MSRTLALVLAAIVRRISGGAGYNGGYRGGYRGGYDGGYRGQPQPLTANSRESGGEVSRVSHVAAKCRVVTFITADTLAMNLDDVGRHPIVRQRDGVLLLRQAAATD